MPKKFDRCVKKVKTKNNVKPPRGKVNAYAACHASMGKKKTKGKSKKK